MSKLQWKKQCQIAYHEWNQHLGSPHTHVPNLQGTQFKIDVSGTESEQGAEIQPEIAFVLRRGPPRQENQRVNYASMVGSDEGINSAIQND